MKRLAAMLFGLAACSVQGSPATRFTGTLTSTSASPLCPPSKASLQIREKDIIFAPDEGTWILTGTLAPDNSLIADKSRIGSNNQLYDTTFEGRLAQDKITGTYKTPRCTFNVALTGR